MNRTFIRSAAALLVAATLGAMPALGQEGTTPARTVVRLKLDGPILESKNEGATLMAAVLSQSEPRSLHQIVSMIRKAAKDPDVHGMALIIEQPVCNLAQLEELTRALQHFRAQGKPIYAYMDVANNLTYAIAAQADHVTLAEYSDVLITGLYAEMMFFKGLLDKIGVEAQVMHAGAYKGAGEPFTRTEPSPELRENINWLLDGLYERWIELIAKGRKLSADEVRSLVDQAPFSAEKALEAKLVDEVSSFAAYRQRIQTQFGPNVKIAKRYGESAMPKVDTSNFFGMMTLFTNLGRKAGVTKPEPGVALIYVDGAIMVGENDDGLFGSTAGSTTLRGLLTQALEDESIRAVVLRVSSPGGSAAASDIIWKAAERLSATKPLIVSMGGVAASGGYYVAIPGNTVYAEGSTITGSIGVVGGKLVLRGLFEEKLGITTTAFSRGKHAGLMSPSQPWTESEKEWLEEYISEVYTQFKSRITASRGPRLKKDLEEIAGGRVYTGIQARELGLIDEIGGLSDALDAAAQRAGLAANYEVYPLPKPSELAEVLNMLSEIFGSEKRDHFEISLQALAPTRSLGPLGALLPLMRELMPAQSDQLLLGLQQLSIIQKERVGLFAPIPLVH